MTSDASYLPCFFSHHNFVNSTSWMTLLLITRVPGSAMEIENTNKQLCKDLELYSAQNVQCYCKNILFPTKIDNFSTEGCPVKSHSIAHEKLRTALVFGLAQLEGPPMLAFATIVHIDAIDITLLKSLKRVTLDSETIE